MIVMGIDPSLSCTGLVFYDTTCEATYTFTVSFPKARGWRRLMMIEQSIAAKLVAFQPDAVVIEHYAFGSKSLIGSVEAGTLIRRILHLHGVTFFEVPPTSLKLWTTGDGKADKPHMGKIVLEKWGFSSPIDDIVDAYALARMGVLDEKALLAIKGVKCHSGTNAA